MNHLVWRSVDYFDSDDTFVQTSYNENIRGKYAGLGDEYRST